ncbi:hypothetical protein HRbin36_01557 [bacterium HR36]|nr:hypothetical protein HRbin36_01557 [bacterium HR36]
MGRLLDFLAFACLVLGMSGLAVGGALYVREHDAPGVRVESENVDLGELPAMKKHLVDLYVTNPTWHTVRLVGIGHC